MTDQTQLTNLKDVKSTLELPYMTFANIIINLHYRSCAKCKNKRFILTDFKDRKKKIPILFMFYLTRNTCTCEIASLCFNFASWLEVIYGHRCWKTNPGNHKDNSKKKFQFSVIYL